ncbi:sensor histidine kinase [Lacibacterium aquatile]|uniref:histidine kinase n=1 Tax=Lacibacterium aquatile TaxID=1168082 RepID=A0ABW5DR03_9PROT
MPMSLVQHVRTPVGRCLITLAAVAAFTAYLLFSYWFRQELEQQALEFRENFQWAVFQTQKEVLSTLRLADQAASGSPVPVEDIEATFDLFISRLNLIRDGRGFAELRQIPALKTLLAKVETDIDAVDAVANSATVDSRTLGQIIADRFAPYEPSLQEISVAALHQTTERNAARATEVETLLNWLEILFLINLLIIGGALVFAFRQSLKAYRSEFRAREQEQEQRFLTETAERAKLEALGSLAGGVAHEINTPVQFISSNLDFLAQAVDTMDKTLATVPTGILTDEQREEWEFHAHEIPNALKDARTGVTRIAEIVAAVKRFAHPAIGQPTEIDIAEEIQTALILTQSQTKTMAKVEVILDSDLPKVMGQPNELNQVLINLIVNSVQAFQESGRRDVGRIDLTARADAHSVEIRIHDDGPGIPSDIRARVFDPFFTTKPVGVGTGQGLALCKRIIATGFGGSITLDETVASGSCFRIVLPTVQAAF